MVRGSVHQGGADRRAPERDRARAVHALAGIRAVEPGRFACGLAIHALTAVHRASGSASELTPTSEGSSDRQRGQAIYGAYCLVCHGNGGNGSPFPTVPLHRAAVDLDDAAAVAFIGEGVPGTAMPGFDKTLTAEQIVDVMAYIRSW